MDDSVGAVLVQQLKQRVEDGRRVEVSCRAHDQASA